MMNFYKKPYSIILDHITDYIKICRVWSKVNRKLASISNEIMKIKRSNAPKYACLQFDEIQYNCCRQTWSWTHSHWYQIEKVCPNVCRSQRFIISQPFIWEKGNTDKKVIDLSNLDYFCCFFSDFLTATIRLWQVFNVLWSTLFLNKSFHFKIV